MTVTVSGFNVQSTMFQIGQAIFDLDMQILAVAARGFGPIYVASTTLQITQQGSPDMTLAVAAGTVIHSAGLLSIAGQNVTIATADATYDRIDLISVVSTSTTLVVTTGSPNATPIAPDMPIDAGGMPNVVLAAVYVPAGASTMLTTYVIDKRAWVPNNRYRTFSFIVGADNGVVLVDADLGPQSRQAFVPVKCTAIEITVAADGGTPNVIVRRNRAGSTSDLLSSALATASSGGIAASNVGGTTSLDGTTTCSATLQNTGLLAGDWLELKSGTAGGTAKRMTIAVTVLIA